jgi:hypothetical protein
MSSTHLGFFFVVIRLCTLCFSVQHRQTQVESKTLTLRNQELEQSLAAVQRSKVQEVKDLTTKVNRHHHQLSGAVRRIHWLLYERSRVRCLMQQCVATLWYLGYCGSRCWTNHSALSEYSSVCRCACVQLASDVKAKDAYIVKLEQKLLQKANIIASMRSQQIQNATATVKAQQQSAPFLTNVQHRSTRQVCGVGIFPFGIVCVCACVCVFVRVGVFYGGHFIVRTHP